MEKLTILIDGKPTVLSQECVVNVEDENPLTSGETMYSSSVWM